MSKSSPSRTWNNGLGLSCILSVGRSGPEPLRTPSSEGAVEERLCKCLLTPPFMQGCLPVPDADWQVYKKAGSCRSPSASEDTEGAARGQESKSAVLSQGHISRCSDVTGISLANVANSPPGRRAESAGCLRQNSGPPGTAVREGTKVKVDLGGGRILSPALRRPFIQKEGG